MSDTQIIPIFNQSAPGIWDDFLRIRAAAMEFNYNCTPTSADLTRALVEYRDEFGRRVYNFAFAAYDGGEMVGFVRGNGVRNTAEIKCLYVLPSHQGHHIGHRLLQAAERSIAPAYKNIELISLGHAEKFYQRHKYTSIYGANTYTKKPSTPNCFDVPLFGFPARIARMCTPLARGLDLSTLIAPGAPLFAHFNADGNIEGILLGTNNSVNPMLLETQDRHPNNWARTSLTRAFKTYHANLAQLLESRTK